MSVPGASVSALLFMSGPADVPRLVVAVVVDTVYCHAFGANTQLVQPLLKRLKAKLDVGIGPVVVRLAALLGLVVAVTSAQEVWVMLYALAFRWHVFRQFHGTTAAPTAFAVFSDLAFDATVNTDSGFVLVGTHEKRGITPPQYTV